MSQEASETVEMFVSRLKEKAVFCNFGDGDRTDEMIRDQVIEKCSSSRLRRKFLERRNITLAQVRELAQTYEMAQKAASSMEMGGSERREINKVKAKVTSNYSRKPINANLSTMKCYACGYTGHIKKDPKCPAKDRKCRKCKKIGHFEKCCKTKVQTENKRGKGSNCNSYVKQVESDSDTDNEYLFGVETEENVHGSAVELQVGGISTVFVIDSGATVNILSRDTWEKLKQSKVKVKTQNKKPSKKLYAYGSKKPLTLLGSFTADVELCTGSTSKKIEAEFFVLEEKGKSLLSRNTAIELGVLRLGPVEPDTISQVENLKEKYPKCFEGLGKLKDFQLKLPIDKDVKPVIQAGRRIPYQMRDKLEKKIKELEAKDIIESVDGPTEWVSPVVIVPKSNGDIRLCVDMRQANTAIRRERYQIPTVDEILQDLNGSKVFSKLDIKWAYHQIELAPESRGITAFITHKGVYQYKRLMFGVSCAPEIYNKIIMQLLDKCQGVHSIFDDIVVHGSSEEEHDKRLHDVFTVLQEKGLTLNYDKCKFNLPEVEFMGHILSGKGVGLSSEKVEAIQKARRPESTSEIRSFLGLVNFSGRFIPDLATLADPLRKLTKKDEPFVWTAEQQNAFETLKDKLSSAETLGYFDLSAKTQVIADASPVGLGAVLVQEKHGQRRVICYASRSLSRVERRYSQTEKEALSLVWACERFHLYIYGTDFELVTDHKPLQYIFSEKSKPSARVERWVLRLQPYKYTVRHIPGSQNIADSLSRLLEKEEKEVQPLNRNKTENYVNFLAESCVPTAMSLREIESESLKDPDLESVRQCLLSGKWHTLRATEYMLVRNELSCINNVVLRGTRIVIPTKLREHVLDIGHEGHPGIVVMKQRLRTKVWWPRMDKDIENYCKSCYGCQLVSNPSKPEPMTRTEFPSGPWQDIAIDFLGPLPSGDNLLVVVDYYSRWVEVSVSKSITAEKTIQQMKKIFSIYGYPMSVTSDNGPQFKSEQFQSFLRQNGISHRRVTPLWPQANGEVERQNRSIMKRIRIAQAEKRNWEEELQTYLMMYRASPHTTTGVSPAELMFGRKLRTKLPDLTFRATDIDIEIRDRDVEKKEKGKIYSDEKRNAQKSEIRTGDKVLVRKERENKMDPIFDPKPAKVVAKNGNCVTIQTEKGQQYKRNVTKVKKFYEKPKDVSYSKDQEVVMDTEHKTGIAMQQVQNSDVQVEDNSHQNCTLTKDSEHATLRCEPISDCSLDDNTSAKSNDVKDIPSEREVSVRRSSRATRGVMPERYKDYALYR